MTKLSSIWLSSLLFILLGLSPAWAWEIRSTPKITHQLESDQSSLPPCVCQIVGEKLRTVYAAPHLTKPPVDATSWPQGFMALSVNPAMDTAYIHELFHYYDWVTGISKTPEFRDALNSDFAAMTPQQSQESNYLRDPQEAFAELCAAHFRGDSYFKTDHYNPSLFPKSKQVIKDHICHE